MTIIMEKDGITATATATATVTTTNNTFTNSDNDNDSNICIHNTTQSNGISSDSENRMLQPLNRMTIHFSMIFIMIIQATALTTTFVTVWTKLRFYVEDSELMTVSTSDLWAIIDVYKDSGAYEIVILVYIFGVVIPMIRVITNTFILIMHYNALKDEIWLGSDYCKKKWKDVDYRTECDLYKLMPWMSHGTATSDHSNTTNVENENASHIEINSHSCDCGRSRSNNMPTLQDLKTVEGRMKWSTYCLQFMTYFTKVAFAQSMLCCLLLCTLSLEFFYVKEDGSIIEGTLSTVTFFGYFMYVTMLYTGFASVLILLFQETRWIRSYKHKMALFQAQSQVDVKGDDDDSVTLTLQNSNLTLASQSERLIEGELSESLMEPLISGQNNLESSSSNIKLGRKDIPILVFMMLSFVCWIFLSCNTAVIKLEYSGTWTEHVRDEDMVRELSLFELVGQGYAYAEKTVSPLREILFINIALLSYVLPTLLMFMCIAIMSLRHFQKEEWYRKLIFTAKCFFICSCHEPAAFSLLFFTLEVSNIVDGMVNSTDGCSEDACLLTDSSLKIGTYMFLTWSVALTISYRLLCARYSYIIYRM